MAGVRVICPYLDDVYEVAQAISRRMEVEMLAIRKSIERSKDDVSETEQMLEQLAKMDFSL